MRLLHRCARPVRACESVLRLLPADTDLPISPGRRRTSLGVPHSLVPLRLSLPPHLCRLTSPPAAPVSTDESHRNTVQRALLVLSSPIAWTIVHYYSTLSYPRLAHYIHGYPSRYAPCPPSSSPSSRPRPRDFSFVHTPPFAGEPTSNMLSPFYLTHGRACTTTSTPYV